MEEHNIKLMLDDTLKKHEISKNKLSQTGAIRYNTVHDMCNHPDKVKQINFSTLSKMINALRDITNDNSINVSDVFVYQDD